MKTVRAYVLLDVKENKADLVLKSLNAMAGVVTAEVTEGPPDVVALLEAADAQTLARLTVRALASVEKATVGVQLLPVRQDTGSTARVVAVRA